MASWTSETPAGVCGACLQDFRDARILPCLHSLCRLCIDELPMTGSDVCCPQCRTVFSLPESGAAGLPRDFPNYTRQTQSPSCYMGDDCNASKESLLWCLTCKAALCAAHVAPHILSSPGNAHPMRPLTLVLSTPSSTSDAGHLTASDWSSFNVVDCPSCPEHKLPMKLLCGSCDSAVCTECGSMGSHKGHSPLRYISEVLQERKILVAKNVADLQQNVVPRLEQSVQSVDNVRADLTKRCDKIRNDIRAAGREVMAKTEAHVLRMIQEVDDVEASRLEVLDQQSKELCQHLKASQAALSFSQRVMDSSNGDSFSRVQALDKRTKVLTAATFPEHPRCNSRLTFESADNDAMETKAKEIIGSIGLCQASANQCKIDGDEHVVIPTGKSAYFTLHTRNKNGDTLTNGGDVITVRCLETPPDFTAPELGVRKNNDGSYTMSCTPTMAGEYQLQAVVNDEEVPSVVTVTCLDDYMIWDSVDCHPSITISDNGRRATKSHNCNCHLSVIGAKSLRSGKHSWKIQLVNFNYSCFGVAFKPLTTHVNDFKAVSYTFTSSGNAYFDEDMEKKGRCQCSNNDTIQLWLDFDNHTLQACNMGTNELGTFYNLPDKEYFPYVTLRNTGGYAVFIDSVL